MMINLYENTVTKLYENAKTINDIENVSWISDVDVYNVIDWATFEEVAKRLNYDSDCPIKVTNQSLRINFKDGNCLYRTRIGNVECWDLAERENSFIEKNGLNVSEILDNSLDAYKQYCIFKDYEEDNK